MKKGCALQWDHNAHTFAAPLQHADAVLLQDCKIASIVTD